MNSTRRFIAGAVCPKCAEMDRIVTYRNEEGTFRECVSCGYLDKQVDNMEMQELDTRVNQDIPEPLEEGTVPLRFFTPDN